MFVARVEMAAASPSKSSMSAEESRTKGGSILGAFSRGLASAEDSGLFGAEVGPLTCALCEEEVEASAATTWSSSAWFCKVCRSNYNRHQEHTKDQPGTRRWLGDMSKEDKMQWYRGRKAANPTRYGRKKFGSEQFVQKEEDAKFNSST